MNFIAVLDRACDAFEADLNSDRSVRIEDFLEGFSGIERNKAFEELFKIELHYLRERGETPDRIEFLERFPDQADIIRRNLGAEDPSEAASPASPVRVRCPHCRTPIELLEPDFREEVTCTTCGSTFHLLKDAETASYEQGAGETVGHFKLQSQLGMGSFGSVWKATDTILSRTVALKIPRKGDLSSDEEEKFFREARAAAQLRHPHIVAVHEVGRDADTIYIVSDYIKGHTLADWLTLDPPAPRQAAEVCRQVALALDHAHESGVIHRDVKPSNILLDADQHAYVMDFGLARRDVGEVTMTVSGAILGTPAYMSPEQAEGDAHHVDRRTDVYSLGVVLFELLTGERPFRGNSRMLLHQVIHVEAPSPRRFNSIIPRDLETICLKCLEKNPDERFRSAKDVAEELQRFLDGTPILSRPISRTKKLWRRAKRNPLAASLMTLLVLILVGLSIAGPIVAWEQKRLADNEKDARKNESEQRGIAETKRKEAEDLVDRLNISLGETEQALAESEWQLYRSQVFRAKSEMEAGRFGQAQRIVQGIPFHQRHWEAKYLARQVEGTQLILRGHQGRVDGAAFSPNGRQIASASLDGTVKVWDAQTGNELRTLREHQGWVRCVAFSPDSRQIATGSTKILKVWDAQTGRDLFTLDAHRGGVESVAFSPDGRNIVSGSTDGSVKVWDTQTGRESFALRGHKVGVLSVAFSPDGRHIASGSADRMVKIWDAKNGDLVFPLRGHQDYVTSVAFSPDGRHIASGSNDRTVKIWHAQTGDLVSTFPGHMDDVTSVAFSPDGRRIASGSNDETLKVWDSKSGLEILTHRGHASFVKSVAFSPCGNRIVSGSWDKTIKVWDARTEKESLTLRAYLDNVRSVAFSPDGRRIASGSDNLIKIWDAQTGDLVSTFSGHLDDVTSVAFSPDGRRIASGSRDKTAKVWDAQTGKELRSFGGHRGFVYSVAFSPDGRRIVSGGDRSVKVWDVESADEVISRHTQYGIIRSAAFSPDGLRIASASGGSDVEVWNVKGGADKLTLRGHTGTISSIAYSRDGRRIVSKSSDQTVRVWDAQTGAEVHVLHGHTSFVASVAFSPDNRRIASGSGRNNTVKVWDVPTGDEVLTLGGHQDVVYSVAFSPDGRRIASASDDNTVRVWDSRCEAEVVALEGHRDRILSVVLSPDGRRIASASMDKTVKVWDGRSCAELLTLHGHENWVVHVVFSSDGRRIVSRDRKDKKIVWDAKTGEQIEGDSFPENLLETTVSPDGLLRVVPHGENVLLIRKNLEYDPWAEDAARRKAMAPTYHAEHAEAAEKDKDWFAAEFHFRHLLAIEDLNNREDVERRHRHAVEQLERRANPGPAVAEKPA